jgi:hypothetical protein
MLKNIIKYLLLCALALQVGCLPALNPLPGQIVKASSPTSIPQSELLPQGVKTISYYRLRVEFSSTADWTDLTLNNPENVLTMRVMSTSGGPSKVDARINDLRLEQPIQKAQKNNEIRLTVEYAVTPEALSQPLSFLLQKGSLNPSEVRIYGIDNDHTILIKEMHDEVQDNEGYNPVEFSADLSQLKNVQVQQKEIPIYKAPKMAWAFYYPWYFLKDWSDPRLRDRPDQLYVSDDPQAIARQIDQAQSAGIDGFLYSWWGPGDITDHIFPLMLDAAKTRNFHVAIYLEILNNSIPRSPEEILSWLTYVIPKYKDEPSFMKVSGKPLVVVWSSDLIALNTWKDIFGKLHAQGIDATYIAMGYDTTSLNLFDGLHEYSAFDVPNLARVDAQTGRAVHDYSLLSDSPEAKLWAATVQPGYDDRLVPGRKGLVQDRQNGDFYRKTFDAAINSDPDWIFITSWNEYPENTYIEPSKLYGDQYLQITHDELTRWKGN